MNYFMKLMSKLGDFFRSKNKVVDNQPLEDKKRNEMVVTGCTTDDGYERKKSGKPKKKVDKDLEAKERAWINEIIKMAKKEKNGSNS
jgi:hypothetical protein